MFGVTKCSCGKFTRRGFTFCPVCVSKNRIKVNLGLADAIGDARCLKRGASIAHDRERKIGRTEQVVCGGVEDISMAQCSGLIASPDGTETTADESCSSSDESYTDLDFEPSEYTTSYGGDLSFMTTDVSVGESETSSELFEIESEEKAEVVNYDRVEQLPDEVFFEFEGENDRLSSACCRNCHRQAMEGFDNIVEYDVVLKRYASTDVRFRMKKGRTFKQEDCTDSDGCVALCSECASYLIKKENVLWKNVWPSYIWQLLTNERVLKERGHGALQCIPIQWRSYWIAELEKLVPRVFAPGMFEYYANEFEPVVIDVTKRRRLMVDMRKSLKLGEMMGVCDDHLMPLVLCPWGCSCYFDEEGHCGMDAVYRKHCSQFQPFGKFSTDEMESSREDFLSVNVDCHLFNPDWKVHPSVYYDKLIGPVFKACKDHNRGDASQHFHLPKSHLCLPSRFAECLAPAVLRSRTLKPSRPKAFSNEYKLQEMLASYCGVDTAVLSQSRQFNSLSHLEDLSEARTYKHRDDIKGLAARLCGQGVITDEYLVNLRERSELFFPSEDKSGMSGGTMATVDDCVTFQRSLRSSPVKTLLCENDTVTFTPTWPQGRLQVHSYDGYGRSPPLVKFKEPWKLWMMCGFACSVPEIWGILDKNVRHTSDWRGYFLSFCAKEILNSYRRGRGKKQFSLKNMDSKMLARLIVRQEDCTMQEHLDVAFKCEVLEKEVSIIEMQLRRTVAEAFAANHRKVAEAQVVMVTKDPCNLVMENVCDNVQTCHFQYELRFIGSKKTTEKNKWDGERWSRHGGAFDKWWKIEKNGSSPMREESLEDLSVHEVQLMIYVRKDMKDIDNLKQEYLKYIGGQSSIFCKFHNLPLVTSVTRGARKSNNKCCMHNKKGEMCQLTSDLECPEDGCSASICSKCRRKFDKVNDLTYVEGKECIPSYDEAASDTDEELEEVCLNYDDDALSEDGEIVEEGSVVDYSDLHHGLDQPLFDVEHCHDVENAGFIDEDEEALEACILSAHQWKKAQRLEFDFGYVGTSVILNKFATALVRRDNRLQASRRERNLVERIVSMKGMGSIPLLHLEGMLFPSVFWGQPSAWRIGVIGAMPTVLLCRHETRRSLNIASLIEHARCRLKSVGTTASTSPHYLSFLFDCLANGALEGNDTRVVLRRGFEESLKSAGMKMKNQQDDLFADSIDNRQHCHNLAASEREKPNTLFVTLTCNQKDHFGVRKIKNYVDSQLALENYKEHLQSNYPGLDDLVPREEEEVRFALHEAAKTLLVRNWMEVKTLLIQYLQKSTEQPLGGIVEKIFCRDEYQGEAGNLSHVHLIAGLKEDYNTDEGRRKIQTAIRGFTDEIVGVDEVEAFINEGVLSDWNDYWDMKEHAKRILPHSCSSHRCLRRVGPGKTELKCRAPDTRLLSKDLMEFCESDIDIEHTADALRHLERVGLVSSQSTNGGRCEPLVEFLKAKRILAPARPGEGNITPVIGRLFAGCRSSMNVQVCTSHGTSRYLVKYLTQIDANNYTVFSVKQGSERDFKVEKVNLHNTKITSSARNERAKLNASRHRRRPRGRSIAQTEMLQIILGYPQVYTNLRFVRIPTIPLGDRAGFEQETPLEKKDRRARKKSGGRDVCGDPLAHVTTRACLFGEDELHRRHTKSQEVLLEDQLHSTVTMDRVSLFGGRPPELLCIDRMDWYFQFFVVTEKWDDDSLEGDKFKEEMEKPLDECCWIDGFGNILKLREKATPKLTVALDGEGFQTRVVRNGWGCCANLLRTICSLAATVGLTCKNDGGVGRLDYLRTRQEDWVWKEMQETFIAFSELSLPVVVFSNVRPKNATKFVIHLLLSMGHFVTETDLWSQPSLRDAFIQAGMVDSAEDGIVTSEHCDLTLKRWIVEQVQHYPISSKVMDDYICSANSILRAILLDDEIPINEMPPCLFTHLQRDTNETVLKYKIQRRKLLVQATLTELKTSCGENVIYLPSETALMSATISKPSEFSCILPRSACQSLESFNEQRYIQQAMRQRVDHYLSNSMTATKNFAIVGPPGAGKTHCLLLGVIYVLAKGLTAITTAMLAERAFLLGGQHFHLLFKMRAREISGRPHRMAELSCIALQKRPEMLSFLRTLDVLFVDEMGQLSADLLSVLDIVMRRVRDSSLFMGGVLIIGSLDQVQLRPIKELPFLLSPYVLTTFKMGRLTKYVRCASCPVLQEMNEIARFFTSDDSIRKAKLDRFAELVSDNCYFADSWDDPKIQEGILRVFPRRRQAAKATQDFLAKKRKEIIAQQGKHYKSNAADTMVAVESHGEWQKASSAVVTEINRLSSEPEEVHFFAGAIYQFTFNLPGHFNATQLAVLLKVESTKDLKEKKPIKVLAAPPGTKNFDIKCKNKDDLIGEGWREVTVGCAPEYTTTLWTHGVKVKRKQYGLKHHVASTVHCAIGHTMTGIATELSLESRVWERAMVVVLISRVRHAEDMIFVGNKEHNITALVEGLKIRCQCDEFMNHIVDRLSGVAQHASAPVVQLSHHPCRPRDITLPTDSSGVVYLLVSLKDGQTLYVGMTQNLPVRLNAHNAGYGSIRSSNPKLRPWALFGYVAGFAGDRQIMRRFEMAWQGRNSYFRPESPHNSLSFAQNLVLNDFAGNDLTVICSE